VKMWVTSGIGSLPSTSRRCWHGVEERYPYINGSGIDPEFLISTQNSAI